MTSLLKTIFLQNILNLIQFNLGGGGSMHALHFKV